MTFLDKGYKIPKAKSMYKKFDSGNNKFRIVSSAITGFEYWNDKNKPVRLKKSPETKPSDVRMNDDDSYTIKHFWAFVILDRWDDSIKIMQLTQSSIMQEIKSLVDNEDWGDPKGYDITVNKTGEKLETRYTVQPSPHKELTADEKKKILETKVNLDVLFDGGNPFDEAPAKIITEDIAF